MGEVSRFSKAKDELKETRVRIKNAIERQQVNLGKFRQLNENLKVIGNENLKNLGNLNETAMKAESKWKEQLVRKERKILHVCFDKFEWHENKDGITQEQFNQFKMTLPMDYQLRLTQTGNWQQLAGDDGILQLDEFIDLLDRFAEEKIEIEYEKKLSVAV